MPYIKPDDRILIDAALTNLNKHLDMAGKLNYTITCLIHKYLSEHKLCYDQLNTIVGVLESVKSEFYRQIVSPYEDKKKLENGAVSELDSLTLEDVR